MSKLFWPEIDDGDTPTSLPLFALIAEFGEKTPFLYVKEKNIFREFERLLGRDTLQREDRS